MSGGLAGVGCVRGDRVAILSHTRLEWGLVDWAALLGGQVVVTVYPVLPPDQIAHILKDSGTRLIFAEDQGQLEKLLQIENEVESLETVVLLDPGTEEASADRRGFSVRSLADLEAEGANLDYGEFEKTARRARPSDVATLIYTSGTTGKPKGVMLTHGNLHANVHQSSAAFTVRDSDTCLSWLPLSHGFERTVGHLLMWYNGVAIAYAESTSTVARDMMEVRPTIIIGLPRLYEKFYEAVTEAVRRGGILKRVIFGFARRVGARYAERAARGRGVSPPIRLGHMIADRLVFSKLRERTGGRVRLFVSGSAPLSAEINSFFFAAGMMILEGYGLTETSPVTNVNPPGDLRFGSVGPPIPGTELSIADDGEILFRGPQIMAGYYNAPEATRAVISEDGWFATGDIGCLDEDGYLTITDRKKNIIVTAAGKNIAPTALEERLARSPLVESVVLIGDRRKFTIVLAVPSLAGLQAAFPDRELTLDDLPELARTPEVRAALEADLLPRVASFARFERPKFVLPVPEAFTVDNGLMTPSLKVRRRAVTDLYESAIDELYEQEEQKFDAEHDGA